MIAIYRRHNPLRCKLTKRTDIKCKCPLWAAGTDANGMKVRASLKTRDWLRAQNKAREWDITGAKPQPSTRATIAELDAAFTQEMDARNLAGETKRKYRVLFKQLKAFAQDRGVRYVNEIDVTFLSDFRATWKDKALSATKKLEELRGICRFAMARKWLGDNPAAALRSPQVRPKPTLPFSDGEMKKILGAAADPRDHALILVMRYAGLRISDATTLSVDSLKNDRLTLHQAKTGESVSVLLPSHVARALRDLPRKNSYFFWTGTSKISSVSGFWRGRIAKVFKAGGVVNGHTHRFRDTFAVSLLTAGVSLEDVSTLLGHQDIRITQKHYSPWVKSRQDALDKAVRSALAS
jgi:integrase/recombinase XerD